MSSSTNFSQTLQFITNVKLEQLEKRRLAYEKHASSVLQEAAALDHKPIEKAVVLLDGIKAWPETWSSVGNLNLENINDWIHHAKSDPGFSPVLVREWCNKLEARIHQESTQFEYAGLFGRLLTQWLQNSKTTPDIENMSFSDDYENVSRQDTADQKAKMESLIFKERDIDEAALRAYLDDLFSGEDSAVALKSMRERLAKFGETLRRTKITDEDVTWLISSLLSTDLLSDEKQATLKEFANNDVILTELASVLNMQLASLDTWSWPKEGVAVEPRRHLNGKVRFYLDYEILTALLLQYIGIKWSIEVRSALTAFYFAAWRDASTSLPKRQRARRDVYMGSRSSYCSPVIKSMNSNVDSNSLRAKRANFHKNNIFMCQMPNAVDAPDAYDEAGNEDPNSKKTNPMLLKQNLFHYLQADTLLTREIHGSCTLVRTDLEWFGPSLAHPTILVVLEFLGVPSADLKFIASFLACPLQFTGTAREFMADPKAYMRNPAEKPRVRQRGTPIAHSLSVLCGEAVMFIMDFAVNQRAGGLFLYRIHDDFWFWNSDAELVASAWKEMNRFAGLAGLTFNKEKTGSIQIGSVVPSDGLPSGSIKWGLLQMDSTSDGRFVIDQAEVEKHIVEFQRQLRSTSSIFSWTQAFNKYMAFFIRSFGEPAAVSGVEHVDSIIQTLAKVQQALFPEFGGNLQAAVSTMMKKDFEVTDIPSGWFLWPTGAGGLDLKDHIVDLLTIRKNIYFTASQLVDRALEDERLQFDRQKVEWDSGARRLSARDLGDSGVAADSPFFTYEEYISGREELSSFWGYTLDQLLNRPSPYSIPATPEIRAAIQVLGAGLEAFRSSRGWDGLSPYWKWIISLHHDEMVAKFGGLGIVEPTSIPVGMVSVFKSSRMRWEQ